MMGWFLRIEYGYIVFQHTFGTVYFGMLATESRKNTILLKYNFLISLSYALKSFTFEIEPENIILYNLCYKS